MNREYLNDFIIEENETIYKAAWMYQRNRASLLLVVDEDKKFKGVVALPEIRKTFFDEKIKYVRQICNEKCIRIIYEDEVEVYQRARNIFAETNIFFIPVIDKHNNIIDIFSRRRAFYLQEYQEHRLPRMNYAESIFKMAQDARELGVSKFSVIEFGVAGGDGLVAAEFHAREIARLFNIEIEVYGFDNAAGLPPIENYRKEAGYIWYEGMFNVMNVEKTKKRLRFAKLILGDIRESLKTFIQEYKPAPIGVIFVDVDRYASTCPILDFLCDGVNEKFFMPRLKMYFDDIEEYTDSIGEHLAIKEFNKKNTNVKILPDNSHTKNKICFRYSNPLYNNPCFGGLEFVGGNYSEYII